MAFQQPMQQPLPISPAASLDVHWDWSAWLGTDTIASFSVSATSGLALSSITRDGAVVHAWVAPQGAPAAGTAYTATCTVTTANTPPRVDSRVIRFIVQADR